MECLSCHQEVGSDEDALMCGDCKLWHHCSCAKGVAPSFYSKFYLAVVQEQKPVHWQCRHCAEQQTAINHDKLQNPVFEGILSNLPPPVESIFDSNSEDELNMSFDLNRTGREGPALYSAVSLSSLEDQATPTGSKMLISPRPVFLDPAPLSTTYSLCQEASGQKVIKDCHGNTFKTTGVIKDQAESYMCAHAGCWFQVRVCEALEEFLCGGSTYAHNHNVHLVDASDSSDDLSSDITRLPSLAGTPFNTPARRAPNNRTARPAIQYTPFNTPLRLVTENQEEEQQQENDLCNLSLSPILQPGHIAPIQTPATIPTRPVSEHPDGYCSGTTDSSDTDDLEPLAIHRFQPLTTPQVDKTTAPSSLFSSSDSSDDNLNITTLCDRLADHEDPDMEADLDLPPSPSDTIPACDSSDSEDEEPLETPAITYSITEGTASGARSKLTDSLGYVYQIKFKLGARIFWTCTEKVGRCSATIIQHRQNQFTRGTASHNHQSSQSLTSTRTNPASDTVASQSDTRCEKSTKSQRKILTSDEANCQEGSNAADEMRLGTESTTTQSRVAKIVKSTITAEPMTSAPADVTTTGSQLRPTNPTGQSNITLQEITTCVQRGSYMPRSVVIDSEGFIYDYKKVEDRTDGQAKTIWKCTHKGPNGACQGQVSLNYTLDFNLDTAFPVYGDFVWVHHHNNQEEGKHITGTEPHNHEADWTAAIMLKLKAMIHKQVFSELEFYAFPRVILKAATAELHEHERVHVPRDQKHISRLRGFTYRQQVKLQSLPREYLNTYMTFD